jgi:tetratricopeptide (TPR) repeat protein
MCTPFNSMTVSLLSKVTSPLSVNSLFILSIRVIARSIRGPVTIHICVPCRLLLLRQSQNLTSETKCSLYLFAVASTYRILQMYPEMLENCNKALLSKPKDITAMNAKAVALGLLEKYDEALQCCNKIIEMDPNDTAAYTSKGLALNGLKRYDEALECWKKAVEIDDNYVDILSNKIHSLQDSRRYDDSKLIRILVMKLAGKGVSYAFIKKYNEALECSNKALELDPNSSDNLNNKSWALNGLKRYNEALECSNKA